ncbi:hypothetical protein B296_00012976 [Ensete ventricosum]|uniref:Uncharacterized protein n=1 Tax=Ensete ventricosum TaxID=4639 RepID=A0A427AMZ9_ENSVE|nr:hypothetical protein B296_00012976 [Ensete ventricosum]
MLQPICVHETVMSKFRLLWFKRGINRVLKLRLMLWYASTPFDLISTSHLRRSVAADHLIGRRRRAHQRPSGEQVVPEPRLFRFLFSAPLASASSSTFNPWKGGKEELALLSLSYLVSAALFSAASFLHLDPGEFPLSYEFDRNLSRERRCREEKYRGLTSIRGLIRILSV